MKPRTLALATFVALFGATAPFGAFANDEPPVDTTAPVSGHSLDPAEPATTPEELYETDKSLAAEEGLDEDADDDDSDDADDDDSMDDATDDAMAQAAAADSDEAAAGDATMSQTTAATTLAPATGDAQQRAQSDVARQDDDRNGTLESGELSDLSELKLRFAEFDADANGSLTPGEYQGWLAAHADPTSSDATAASDAAASQGAGTRTTFESDSTAMSEDDDALEAADETDDDVAAEVSGEPGRPSDAGTPDVDHDGDSTAGLTAQTADEAEDTGNEDLGGEEDRPSDAGTPDSELDGDNDDDLGDEDE